MTNMTVARQLLGKHIFEVTLTKIRYPLLGSRPINTHSRATEDDDVKRELPQDNNLL